MNDASAVNPIPIESVYAYCPRCGHENSSVGQVPFRCVSCEFTAFFGPVAAVGALIVDEESRLLLVRRARDPGKGCWGLPGGFVDRNETVEEALSREVMEETKLTLVSCNLMLTHPNQYNYRGVTASVIDLFYTCDVQDRSVIELALDELDHYEWVRPSKTHLDNMAFESNRIAVEHWIKGTPS